MLLKVVEVLFGIVLFGIFCQYFGRPSIEKFLEKQTQIVQKVRTDVEIPSPTIYLMIQGKSNPKVAL